MLIISSTHPTQLCTCMLLNISQSLQNMPEHVRVGFTTRHEIIPKFCVPPLNYETRPSHHELIKAFQSCHISIFGVC